MNEYVYYVSVCSGCIVCYTVDYKRERKNRMLSKSVALYIGLPRKWRQVSLMIFEPYLKFP